MVNFCAFDFAILTLNYFVKVINLFVNKMLAFDIVGSDEWNDIANCVGPDYTMSCSTLTRRIEKR